MESVKQHNEQPGTGEIAQERKIPQMKSSENRQERKTPQMKSSENTREQKVPRIKICGITQECEIRWLNEAGISYAGFVLYEKSSRYIPVNKTKKLLEQLNNNIKKVAVVVSPDAEFVKQVVDAGFDILQVHGNLTEEVLAATEIPVWRAVNLTDESVFEELVREYRDLSIELSLNKSIDKQVSSDKGNPAVSENPLSEQRKVTALLMDAKEFGSGKTFGWDAYEKGEEKEKLRHFRQALKAQQIQFVLAGGLTPDNVSRGIEIFAPDIVDVSSGVEKEPGQGTGKDREKIQEFVQTVQGIEKNEI